MQELAAAVRQAAQNPGHKLACELLAGEVIG